MKSLGLVVMSAMILATIGCADLVDDESTPDDIESDSGLALSVSINANTDVAGFRYQLYDCEGHEVLDEVRDLEDLVLPGMIPKFDDKPFDSASRHHFADLFTTLAAGCYDVTVTPVTAAGQPSQDCGQASEQDVMIVHGKTTEIVLISQCEGPESGAIDVVAATNHPPVLEALEYSKFNRECEMVKVCAAAFDPDGDPIRFSWKQVGGPKLSAGIHRVNGKTSGSASDRRECVEFMLGEAGDYFFELEVYDLHWAYGKLVRYEDSAVSQSFPVYAATNSEVECKTKK